MISRTQKEVAALEGTAMVSEPHVSWKPFIDTQTVRP